MSAPKQSAASLSHRLRMAREARGWSQGELARRTKLPPTWSRPERRVGASHIALIERGERDNLTAETAAALCEALGCTMDWLLLGKGEPPAGVEAA